MSPATSINVKMVTKHLLPSIVGKDMPKSVITAPVSRSTFQPSWTLNPTN